jgi:hypothetical protein
MNTPKRRMLAVGLATGAVGAGVGWIIGTLAKSRGAAHIPGWVLLCLPVLIFLAIALHEAGHVAAGLLSGFRFHLCIVGPLRLDREGDRLRLKFNPSPALWGGLAGCVPQSYGPDLPRRMLLFVAGGPLFSLLGAAALIPAALLGTSSPGVSFLFTAFGILSAGMALATLIPLPSAGFTNDGARIRMLLRDGPEGRRWTALASVAGLLMAERPRDWPSELMDLLGDGKDAESDAVHVCWLRHLWHQDRHEWEDAKLWLERGLANVDALPKAGRPGLYLSAAYFYARHGNDSALARQYLDLGQQPGLHNPKETHLVKAAVLVSEGRTDQALPELELASRALDSKPARVAAPAYEAISEMTETTRRAA